MSHSIRRRPGGLRRLRSLLAVAAVMGMAVAPALVTSAAGAQSEDETIPEKLIRSGPMTPQKAELLGKTVDFGPNCDPETGRVKLPSIYAPPCVSFKGRNGGSTSEGVTEDTIKVVAYVGDPAKDPLLAAQIRGAGADLGVPAIKDTIQGYFDMYNEVFEQYGRKFEVEFFDGTGSGADTTAAKADAIAIAAKKPFAVVGGPLQSTAVFADELASRGVVCVGNCALALPQEIIDEQAPYLYSNGPSPEEAGRLAGELIGKIAGRGTAEYAGDPDLHDKKRVFGLAHYDTPDGQYEGLFKTFRDALAKHGVKLKSESSFFLDPNRSQEYARTIITKFKDAGVTTVIYTGDPLTPASFTTEATKQDYSPEWVLGPSVLGDTTIFARTYDQEQWANGFGVSLIPARLEEAETEAVRLYDWFHGEEPPSNTRGVIHPGIDIVARAVHMAGPKLTPKAFRDGLFRYPVTGGGATTPQSSFGKHGFWPFTDYNNWDDAALIWWDPALTGKSEVGDEGQGVYRYANQGKRYTLGTGPTKADSGLFEDSTSVTIFEQSPPESTPPDYPSPAGG